MPMVPSAMLSMVIAEPLAHDARTARWKHPLGPTAVDPLGSQNFPPACQNPFYQIFKQYLCQMYDIEYIK